MFGHRTNHSSQRRTKKQNQPDIFLTRHRQILTPPQNWPTPYSIRESRNEVTYQLLVGWLVDSHFKWPEVIISALDIFATQPVSNHCPRKRIQSTSLLAELGCKNPAIEHIRSQPYHPQSNGQADKFVNIMKRNLLKTNEEGGSDGVKGKIFMNNRTSIHPALNK